MSRKHYIAVANILAGDLATCITTRERQKVISIAYSMADLFKADNARFDRERFYAAVGIPGH